MNMENCSNCSIKSNNLAGAGFGVFLAVFLIPTIISFLMNPLIICALCMAKSVAKLVRIFLINLLFAGLGVTIIVVAFLISGLTLNFSSFSQPDLGVCRFLVWGISVGGIARQYSLAGFSLVILLIVRYNKKELNTLLFSS